MKKREEGFLLITVYWLLTLLVIFAAVGVTAALADLRASQRLQANLQAFYLAEAGIDQSIVQLRQNYLWTAGFTNVSQGSSGNYSVEVGVLNGNRRNLAAQGNSTLLATPTQRRLEVILQQFIPPFFFDNAIWASRNLDFNGNSYSVTGDVRHGDLTPSSTSGVTGTVTYDPAANPLPRLSFQRLHDIAQAQGNIYDAPRLSGGPGVFPISFWRRAPGTNGPDDPGEPNVNYITADLVLNGNIGTLGGFFVVVGNVLTDPTTTEDTRINGNGQINGAIYTTGDFRINGGGNGLNVNGGVWAGEEVRLNGNANLQYNQPFMDAIEALGINADVQVLSWQDLSG